MTRLCPNCAALAKKCAEGAAVPCALLVDMVTGVLHGIPAKGNLAVSSGQATVRREKGVVRLLLAGYLPQ